MSESIVLANKKLSDLQDYAVNLWVKNKAIGTIEWFTGTGKTTVMCKAIYRLLKKFPNSKIDVVVPTLKLKEDWVGYNKIIQVKDLKNPTKIKNKKVFVEGHLDKWKFNKDNVKVYVINTYLKHTERCNLLLIDEAHRLGAETFYNILLKRNYEFLLCATATLERLDKRHEMIKKFAPIVHKLDESTAIKEGFVVPNTVYNLAVKATDKIKEDYYLYNNRFNNLFKYFEHNFNLALECSQSINPRWNPNTMSWYDSPVVNFARTMGCDVESLEILISRFLENRKKVKANKNINKMKDKLKQQPLFYTDLNHRYHPLRIYKFAIAWRIAMVKRKTVIYQNEEKIKIIKEITDKLKGKIITFAEDIKTANKLEEFYPNIFKAYHTEIKSAAEKRKIIEDFENNNIRGLSTVKALTEGFNVQNASICINISQTRSITASIQKRGRVGRRDYSNSTKKAITINLYLDDFYLNNELIKSSEKKTLLENQKNLSKVFWINSVDDIFTEDNNLNLI